jgi:sortase A
MPAPIPSADSEPATERRLGPTPLRHDVTVQRLLRIVSTTLITAALVVLADVGVTLAWQEPVSWLYGSLQQREAAGELADLEDRFPSAEDIEAAGAGNAEQRARRLANRFAGEVERGDPIGRIRIDRIGLDMVVIEGTDTNGLRRGPGHYMEADDIGRADQGDGSAFPGQGSTIGIAGHRTTYLAPFRRIDQIRDGDEMVLEMPYGTFTYVAEKHEVVSPQATRVIRDVGHERLVLTACHPLYSAAERYVVFARLTDIDVEA